MIDGKAFYKLSYGLYVVGSNLDGKLNGQIANSFFQITSNPPMVAVSINKQNLTHKYIHESCRFSLSVLSEDTSMDFIGRFGFKSGRDFDKFSGTGYKLGEEGVPIVLDNCLSYFEVKVEREVDVFTHTIFIGRVVNAEVIAEGEQMTYAYYQKVKRGTSPKTAPTYIAHAAETPSKKGEKYVCSICGYVYDPEKGDPDGGIKPGTLFEDIPDDWTCPICGASKKDFHKE